MVPSARLRPIGPQERLLSVVGSLPEYSTSNPGRFPWLYLINDGDAEAIEIEVYFGGDLLERPPAIPPGKTVQVRWPPTAIQVREANPESLGERFDLLINFKSAGGQGSFVGDVLLGKDGTPMLVRGGLAGERSSPHPIK
jgi:hypothetical protein